MADTKTDHSDGVPEGYTPRSTVPDAADITRDRRNVNYKAIDYAYDACIDIHSIECAKDGWPICGKNWNALQKLFARLIGVVGDFKDGKTFLISLLSRRTLPHDSTLHTPGICITLPPTAVLAPAAAASGSNSSSSKNDTAPPAASPSKDATSSKTNGGPRTRNVRVRDRANRRRDEPKEPEFIEDCYIDTEGTDQPCAEKSLKDIRATEFLLRTLVIEVSSRVIFVTRKWGFQAQTKVADLVQQLNTQDDPNQRITPSQKLIVVHNHPDALDMTSLARSIQEVEESYYRAAVPSDPLFRGTRPWVKMPTSDKKQFYYESVYTVHFFLMHNEPGKDYNISVVDELRNQLKSGAPPVERNIIEHIRNRAAINLRQYIKGWDIDQCDLVLTSNNEGVPMLVPDYKVEYKDDPSQLTTNILDEENVDNDFQLQQIAFTGHSVISDGYSQLQGELQINKQARKMKVFVKVGGISSSLRTPKNIKIHLHENCHSLEIEVALKPTVVEQGYSVVTSTSTFKYGHGVYKVMLPEHLHFILPECNELDLLEVQNGMLILTLDLARDVRSYNSNNNNDNDDDDDEEEEDDDEEEEEGVQVAGAK